MSKKKKVFIKEVLRKIVMEGFSAKPDKSFNYKQISANINIHDNETRKEILEIILEELASGRLIETEKGKYQINAPSKVTYEGIIDMTASGSAYFICEELENDVFIAPRKLRNALNGDRVKIHIFGKKQGNKFEGEVLEIIKRARTEFTGIIEVSDRFAFVIPDHSKMLNDIFVPLSNLNGAKDKDKVRVKITEWPAKAKNPIGEVVEVLGKPGDNNTEMNAILLDYGFPTKFPEKVLQASEEIPEEISAREIAKRRDFRDVLTFTIDPVDAKDFDDAISFKYLPNGRYEIGVHIADVSYYVKEGTLLDQEAFERATSVYLVDRVIPMLPERLSNNLCSLRPKEDKLTFSAVFELDEHANIHDQWFGKTIIHSNHRFAYEEVQEILEKKEGLYATELLKLNELAYHLRSRKFKNGAIAFESTEVKFKLDETGKPVGVYVKERKDAHKLIEDYMLLANRKVAEFIYNKVKGKNRLTFVYRHHDQPDPDALNSFASFASRFGYKLKTNTQKEISASLNQLMTDVEGKKEQNILTGLAIRSMAKAIYTTKHASHYGLAFEQYTHFTSPIRRYPDVMVHRLLEHYLNEGKNLAPEAFEKACEHSSQMEKKAADAERASIKYKQAEYLKDNIGQTYKGIISGVTEWGIYVEIIENKCEGMVRIRDLTDDFYVLDPQNYRVVGQRRRNIYQLGDEVMVKVKNVDLAKRQLDFTMIGKSDE